MYTNTHTRAYLVQADISSTRRPACRHQTGVHLQSLHVGLGLGVYHLDHHRALAGNTWVGSKVGIGVYKSGTW